MRHFSKLGELVEVPERSKARRDLSKLRLKFYFFNPGKVLTMIIVSSSRVAFHMGLRSCKSEEFPLRVLTIGVVEELVPLDSE